MLSFQYLIGTFAVFCPVFLRLFDRNFCGPLLEAFAESMGRNPKSMALYRRLWVQKNLQDESWRFGAENETRTRDPDLGKVVLYQLSYFRSISKTRSRGTGLQRYGKKTNLQIFFHFLHAGIHALA